VTLLYGLVVLAVLLVMSIVFYRYAVSLAIGGVQTRLRGTAVAIASGMRPETIDALRDPSTEGSPTQKALLDRLRVVAENDPDISDIYVFRPSDKPGVLIFVADHVVRANAKPGVIGEEYVPAKTIHMLEGFERPTVENAPYTDQWGTVLSGYAPIRDAAGKAIAIVGIDIQLARIEEIRSRVRWMAFLLFAGAALMLLVLAKVVAVMVREPLYKIVDATTAIMAGEQHKRLSIERKDEFGVVGRHFEVMASGLQERDFIKQTFGTYVSPQVVRRLLEDRRDAVRGEQRRVAVLFSDLRSFTTLSEKLTPQETVALLNDYLERMTQCVVANGGRIDKFIGDAMMADWGALETDEDAAPRAVQACLDMEKALDELNALRRDSGQTPLRMGIGVHMGDVVAGSIGSQRKLEFTVIGDAVNAASRFEGLCKVYGVNIVASRVLVDAMKTPPPHRRLEKVIVAGKSEPIEIVELFLDDDPRVSRIPVYERGMTALYENRWSDAVAAFEEAVRDLYDPAASFQLARAKKLEAGNHTWDGIERRAK
jgi:adenylate cyclase